MSIKNGHHIKLALSEKKGRYIRATTDIPANTIIIREPAYATVSKSPLFCSNCFAALARSTTDRPFLCSPCLKEGGNEFGFDVKDKSLLILCYKVALQIIKEVDFNYEVFENEKLRLQLKDALSNDYKPDFRAVAKLFTADLDVSAADVNKVCFLIQQQTNDLSAEQTEDLVRHIFSCLPCNVQGIRCISESNGTITEQRIGSGIYLTLALMNHSCSPNTRIYFEKSDVVVRTTVAVSEGDELYHNYGPDVLHFPKYQRQEMLKRQYMFVCDCTSCSVPNEEEPQYALKCEFCSASFWLGSTSKCKSCGRGININKLHYKTDTISYQLQNLRDNFDPDTLDRVVEEATHLYGSENVMLGNLMDTCGSLYVTHHMWDKAIHCAGVSCGIVERAVGRLSQTYAIELLKLCQIRYLAGFEHRDKSSWRKDGLFCVSVLEQSKYYEFNRLKQLKQWLDIN